MNQHIHTRDCCGHLPLAVGNKIAQVYKVKGSHRTILKVLFSHVKLVSVCVAMYFKKYWEGYIHKTI